MLVFDLDTLRISEKQLSPNFELAVKEASPMCYTWLSKVDILNNQISIELKKPSDLVKCFLALNGKWFAHGLRMFKRFRDFKKMTKEGE